MNLRILNALIIKESLQIIRDPSSILIAFVLPLILLLIFAYGINLDSNHLKIGLVLNDQSPVVTSLTKAFQDSRFFTPQVAHHRHALQTKLVRNQLRGVVDVGQRFSANTLQKTHVVELQVISDGSEPQIAAFVQNYVAGLVSNWSYQEDRMAGKSNDLITIQARYWYNQALKSQNFLIPGSIVVIMTIIGSLLTALVIAREWERGTMESLMATPVSVVELLLGKLIPYFILGMGSLFLCTAIAVFFFKVPFRGSVFALSVVSASFLIAALGQGLLISTVTKNQFLASQLAITSAFLPALNLSGFIFEINSMPKPIQWLTHILPARYFITSLQTLFLTGDVWVLLIKCMSSMLLIGSFFLLLTLRKTKKRID